MPGLAGAGARRGVFFRGRGPCPGGLCLGTGLYVISVLRNGYHPAQLHYPAVIQCEPQTENPVNSVALGAG
jgi:hypothetical protein